MSLLTICQSAARIIKIEVPSSIVNNTGEEAQLLLQCAQFEGMALSRRPQGGWVNSILEKQFNTVSLGPFSGTVANTGSGGRAQITGLSSTAGITALLFGVAGNGIIYNSVVASVDGPFGVTLNLPASTTGPATDIVFGQFAYAVPSDFQRPIDNTMWDRTRYWPMAGPLSPQQQQFFKSSIFCQATIQRRFWFQKIGNATYFIVNPLPTDNNSQLAYNYVSNAWCQSSANAPQTQWLADTDTGILDEYLMTLGVTWRALDRLGVDYSSALDDYVREVDKAVAQDGGAATLSLVPTVGPFLLSPTTSVSEGSWPSTPV
jgi:hypothetical protein